ncbi:MAG: hypothetical protein JNK82_11425 [Myxococcaceae bacterium]|nr:hypothetical protein [Myxococcaceae bacterium]
MSTRHLCLLFLLGCQPPPPPVGPPVTPPVVPPDAGNAPAIDAGTEPVDAGTTPVDAGSSVVDAGAPPPCTGQPGLYREQTFESGGKARRYLLYVPASYACATSTPVLLDFHGAYGGVSPPAEEVYTLDGAMAAADRDGFILVRPRSLTVPNQGRDWHYWDASTADVRENLQFVRGLLADLRTRYHVAADRVYALGFSNGTQLALRLLAEADPIVHGVAVVGGGYWSPFALPASLADRGRVFVATGYRDYHYTLGVPQLVSALKPRGYPMERYLERPMMSGHELFGWTYPEAFAWLDRAEKPAAAGAPPTGWSSSTSAPALTVSVGLSPWLASGIGAAWSVAPGQLDALPALPTSTTPVTGICTTPAGTQLAAVNEGIARRPAGATTWSVVRPPTSATDPVTMVVDVLCLSNGRAIASGFSGFSSDDDGLTWSPMFMGFAGWGSTQVNRLHQTGSGRVIGAGDYWLGTSIDRVVFGSVREVDGRLLAVTSFAGGFVWAAGTHGLIARSSDDGTTWAISSAGEDADIYDLVAVSKDVVVAVGARGLMLVTRDGGATWSRVETGQTGMLTAVRRSGAALENVTVFAEGGTALELPVP